MQQKNAERSHPSPRGTGGPRSTGALFAPVPSFYRYFRGLSLRLDLGDADIFRPRLVFLDEERLPFFGRADERVSAEFIQKSLGLVGGKDLFEPAVDLVDD